MIYTQLKGLWERVVAPVTYLQSSTDTEQHLLVRSTFKILCQNSAARRGLPLTPTYLNRRDAASYTCTGSYTLTGDMLEPIPVLRHNDIGCLIFNPLSNNSQKELAFCHHCDTAD